MTKLKIGITGQQGFIGQYLYNVLGLFPDEFERVDFHRGFFDDVSRLVNFVGNCDVIVHLAALNRHNDLDIIYQTNIELVRKLVDAFLTSGKNPHVIFSSSSQEERDNLYGLSKKEGRELLANWAIKSGALFTGMIIPNVFGPFGNPYYNSFIATFCHQLILGEVPKIEVDGQVKLIYIAELVNVFLNEIRSKSGKDQLDVPHTAEYKVTEILGMLKSYKVQYLEGGVIPSLSNHFEINLFNTFRSFINIEKHYPVKYVERTDSRGSFIEIIRLNTGGQVSFSETLPGMTRGNHFHTRKIERFAVINGEAVIQLRKIGTSETIDLFLSGDSPAYVDIPIWYTHNIKNIGNNTLFTIFWINEFYNPEDSDTYFEIV
jgi:UDP-2-acetamido-2,6-beta-L-arabino-hexul-4-ose reductase